jgi:uncharacterized protein YecE (DUF72 family)
MGRIRIGTSGFSYKEWRGDFYPGDLPDREFLRFYATRFDSVEIDSTFYRMPNAKTIDGWKNATPEDFQFALKASQQITHREQLRVPSDALRYLLGIIAPLEHRLGYLLVQLPPYSKCDLGRLTAFLAVATPVVHVAVEFRNDTWCREGTYDVLRRYGAALCIRDDDLGTTPTEITAPFTSVRLRRSQYDAAHREEWQQRIHGWADAGVDVYAYLKHENNPEAPRIAQEFAEALGVSHAHH